MSTKTEWATRNTSYDIRGNPIIEQWGASTEEIARSNTEWLGENAVTIRRDVTEWESA